MRRILTSVFVIALVASATFGATRAFFSDTETSTGNVLTAGQIDLTVTSEVNAIGPTCVFENTPGGPLFNCTDLKPGDSGEATLHFNLTSNPAWACVLVDNVVDSDNTCVEPENEAEGAGVCGEDDDGGELDDALLITAWVDDGDGEDGIACNNILDGTEKILSDNVKLSSFSLPSGDLILPVSDTSVSSMMSEPLQPGEHCIGVAWNVPDETRNDAQTDQVGGKLTFYVEQSRNNETFTCANHFAE